MYKSWLRSLSLDKIAPIVLAILAALDLISTFVSVARPYWPFTTILFLATAILLFVHHQRLQAQIARHQTLLKSLRDMVSKHGDELLEGSPVPVLSTLLQTAVSTLSRPGVQELSAILAFRGSKDPRFNIALQEPRQTIPPGLATAIVTSISRSEPQPAGTLVYVPNTNFRHGIVIESHKEVNTLNIIARVVPPMDFSRPHSVLFIQLWNTLNDEGPSHGPAAMFCFMRDGVDSMDPLDFGATRMIAALLDLVLQATSEKRQEELAELAANKVPEQVLVAAAAASGSVFRPSSLASTIRTAWKILTTSQSAANAAS
jgi:hypothetical protein